MAKKITATGKNIKLPKYVQNKSAEYQELFRQYKQLAKTADQRLVRLHSYTYDKFYKGVENYAYKSAMRSIRHWSGEGATRWNTKAPDNINALKAKINEIKNFLDSPTSTKEGIKKVYKNKADALNKKIGQLNAYDNHGKLIKGDLTWQELANFFEKSANKLADMAPGSNSVLVAIDQIKRFEITKENALELLGMIKDENGRIINTRALSEDQREKYADQINKPEFASIEGIDDIEKEVILYMLEEEGIDWNDLKEGT